MNNSGKVPVVLIALLCIFLLGVIKLFAMRFESGDVYPEYSSLRSDPMGTMVFFESLAKIRGLTVSRNYKSLSKVPDSHERSTLFYIGTTENSLHFADRAEAEKLEALVADGWRTVILLNPSSITDRECITDCEQGVCDEKTDREKTLSLHSDSEDSGDATVPEGNKHTETLSLLDRWGLRLSSGPLHDNDGRDQPAPRMVASEGYPLTDSIARYHQWFFQNLDEQWRTVYSVDGNPVMVERHFGKGTVIISTDSYLVSNEAMWRNPGPGLLVWLVGGNSSALFDETHLGIQERPGIAALARRYRLHGLFGGLLFMALLFIWKNSTSLVPKRIESEEDHGVRARGKDSFTGLVNLLRRTIPHSELLKTCYQEWERANVHRMKYLHDEVHQIREVMEYEQGLPPQHQNPLKAYQRISRILSERNMK